MRADFDIKLNQNFADTLFPQATALDEAVQWIKTNLAPEDVFDHDELVNWATENGYIEEE